MFLIARLIFDILIIVFSYISAYLIKFGAFSFYGIISFQYLKYYQYLLFIIALYVFYLYLFGMYRGRKGFLIEIDELLGCFFAVTSAWITLIVFTFLKGEYEYSRSIIIISFPISIFLFSFFREIILAFELYFRKRGYGSKKAAVFGSSDLALAVSDKIKKHPSYGVKFLGFIGDTANESLGKPEAIEKIVEKYGIQVIYVADKDITRDQLAELASFCDAKGLELGTIPDVFQILTTSPSVEDIEGLPIVSLKRTRFNPTNRFAKRTFDLLLSLFGIFIFSLPMIFISILIRIFSPGGPVIYSQERVGRKGKIFHLYKFRTMIPDAEANTGPVLATGDDPRKTLIGKILRSTNLDELPQLFNIMKGDMSFVGPRPERPVFVEEFKQIIPKYMERHKIKPGLAGWAQLHGGYHMPAEEKIKYDLYYIENWTFILDIKIILKYIQIAFTLSRKN